MYDEDDFGDSTTPQDAPSIDDLFNIVTIDKVRKLRIRVKLVDQDGDEVPIREAAEQLMSYIEDKTRESTRAADNENNYIISKLAPLVGQVMIAGLPKVLGNQLSILMLSLEHFRISVSTMMILSFVMLKWVQDKKLKIITIEESITDDEMEKSERLSKISSAATIGRLLGIPAKDIIKQLVDAGQVTSEEVESILGEIPDSDDDEPTPEDTE